VVDGKPLIRKPFLELFRSSGNGRDDRRSFLSDFSSLLNVTSKLSGLGFFLFFVFFERDLGLGFRVYCLIDDYCTTGRSRGVFFSVFALLQSAQA
jgi:hypothetical protein